MASTSTSTQQAAAIAHSTGTGPWLGHLPLEIREVIYQYALVDKVEHRMKSAEYDHNRDAILAGLDYTRRYHTAILRTNSSIYREAKNVFRRDNFMVCLQLRQCNFSGSTLKYHGFVPFANYDKTKNLPSVAMTLAFGPHPTARDFQGIEWDSENYVFDSEDLPIVCTSLLRMSANRPAVFTDCPLRVTIDASIGEFLRESTDGFPHRQSRLRTLLDPLRRLHGLDDVNVEGPGSAVYKVEIIASMSRRPNAEETMRQALLAASHGDKACESGKLDLAIDMYKAGLELSFGNYPDPWDEDDLWDLGPQALKITQREIDDTTIRLQTGIAAAYFRLGRLRMARVYAERVYGPYHDYDNYRHHRHKFPLQIEADRGSLFAKLLVVAAQISWAHGKVDEALEELCNALQLDADCKEAKALQSQYQIRKDQLNAREAVRQQARDRQAQRMAEEVTDYVDTHEYPQDWDPEAWQREMDLEVSVAPLYGW